MYTPTYTRMRLVYTRMLVYIYTGIYNYIYIYTQVYTRVITSASLKFAWKIVPNFFVKEKKIVWKSKKKNKKLSFHNIKIISKKNRVTHTHTRTHTHKMNFSCFPPKRFLFFFFNIGSHERNHKQHHQHEEMASTGVH